ncbi:MAG: phage baseplate assembly protein V [Paraburkholderia sp.]|uniref:phage baseplate assembly protein V n=1 Tax=Burkholderiaceae TaxID=119060 RepID=UPI002017E354|nr:phage baseplate assembly protein V [Burkholderia sp. 4M9327F10]
MSDYAEQHYLRTMMMVRRGKISLVNDSGVIQTVQLPPSGLETRDNLKRIAEYGLTSNPPEGTDAYILNIGGDPSNGAVVGTNHQQTRPTGLEQGETQIYNGPAGTSVYLSNGGIVVNANGQPVTVNGSTTVTIVAATEIIADTPLLKCTGDILDNCDTNTRTMAGMRTVANGHTHKVMNVQGGSSTIETNPPDQDE